MKKFNIMSAVLTPNGTTDTEGRYCEFAYTETVKEEYGEEWNGDIKGYVENLDTDFIILDGYKGAIHNLPENAIVVGTEEGTPMAIFWNETV